MTTGTEGWRENSSAAFLSWCGLHWQSNERPCVASKLKPASNLLTAAISHKKSVAASGLGSWVTGVSTTRGHVARSFMPSNGPS
eukprot:1135971-Prymnesium_polylepis.2